MFELAGYKGSYWWVAYIDNDFEDDEWQHGDLLHADDTYAFVIDVGDAAVLYQTHTVIGAWYTYKIKFMITNIV
jgi:hypothetical protein